jgi:hypothetical protein
MTQEGQQLLSSGIVSQGPSVDGPSVQETELVAISASDGPAGDGASTQESFTPEGHDASTQIAESAVEPVGSENAASQESIAAVHASSAPADRSTGRSADPAEPSPTEILPAPDVEAVVAKVLARMNPEMFQSVAQQLLKPVIEAIVRSELEKKR